MGRVRKPPWYRAGTQRGGGPCPLMGRVRKPPWYRANPHEYRLFNRVPLTMSRVVMFTGYDGR